MIKMILMVYLLIPLVILSVLTPHKELVGACMAGAFACGMFCSYFIHKTIREG